MDYDSQIKKVLQINQSENKNQIHVDKLRKYNWLPRPENFRKEVGVISLCKAFSPQTGTTLPDGFVNPLVTVMVGIPSITPPPVIIPVPLMFAIAGTPVTLSPMLMAQAVSLLLVATSGDVTPVPDTEEETNNLDITVTKSDTQTPTTLAGTPTFISPGVISVPLSQSETTVSGDNPTITVTFSSAPNNSKGSTIQIPLSKTSGESTPLVSTTVNTNSSVLGQSPLGNMPVIPPTIQFTPSQIGMPNGMTFIP